MSILTNHLDQIWDTYRRGDKEGAIHAAKEFITYHYRTQWGDYAVHACDNDPEVVAWLAGFRDREEPFARAVAERQAEFAPAAEEIAATLMAAEMEEEPPT